MKRDDAYFYCASAKCCFVYILNRTCTFFLQIDGHTVR